MEVVCHTPSAVLGGCPSLERHLRCSPSFAFGAGVRVQRVGWISGDAPSGQESGPC